MWGSKISAGGGKHRERTFRLLYRQSEHLNSGKKNLLDTNSEFSDACSLAAAANHFVAFPF
jgi:hypothetical protein